jgi:hypothetical protein
LEENGVKANKGAGACFQKKTPPTAGVKFINDLYV